MPIVGLYVVHDLSNTIWAFLLSASNTTARANALLAGAAPGSPIVRLVNNIPQDSIIIVSRIVRGAERARRVIRVRHAIKASQELRGRFKTRQMRRLLHVMPVESSRFTLVVIERAQIELNV